VFGAERVGVRLSPHAYGDGIADSDPAATFGHVAGVLNNCGIAYLHLIEATKPGLRQSPPEGTAPILPVMRRAFRGPLIVNGGYDQNSANEVIAAGAADLVAFGTLFIANPDLVERFQRNASLNLPDPSTYYDGNAKGYIDYPMLAELTPGLPI
jgi:N-ethylmaleimide reductase